MTIVNLKAYKERHQKEKAREELADMIKSFSNAASAVKPYIGTYHGKTCYEQLMRHVKILKTKQRTEK